MVEKTGRQVAFLGHINEETKTENFIIIYAKQIFKNTTVLFSLINLFEKIV